MLRERKQKHLLAQIKGRVLPVLQSVSPFSKSPSGLWWRVRPSLHLRPNASFHSFSVVASLGALGPCPWGRAVSFRGGARRPPRWALRCLCSSCRCMAGCPFRCEWSGLPRRRVWPRCLGVIDGTAPSEPRQSLMAPVPAPGLTLPPRPAHPKPSGAIRAHPARRRAQRGALSLPAFAGSDRAGRGLPCGGLATAAAMGRVPLPNPSHAPLRACGLPAGQAGRGRPRRPPAWGA